MILGNKCDLEESRVVTEQKGRILAAEYEAGFFETSAKSGQNVEEAILTLAFHRSSLLDHFYSFRGSCLSGRQAPSTGNHSGQ